MRLSDDTAVHNLGLESFGGGANIVAVDALAGHGQKDVAGDELAGIPDEPAHTALLGTRVGDELALYCSVNLTDS